MFQKNVFLSPSYTAWSASIPGKFRNFAEYIGLSESEGGKRMHKPLRCPAAELRPDNGHNGDNQTNLDTGRIGSRPLPGVFFRKAGVKACRSILPAGGQFF